MFDCVNHLAYKEETDILTHSTEHLAHIEEQATLDELHLHVNDVWDHSTRWFYHNTIVAKGLEGNYILMFQVFQNGNFVLDL